MNVEQVLNEFKKSGALLEGHFILSSGLHSDKFLQKALVFQDAKRTAKLCKALAAKVKKEIKEPITAIVSPAVGGIVPGYEMGRQLGVPAIFTERVDGKLVLRRGFTLRPGERILVVEDVVTRGGRVVECLEIVRQAGGNTSAVAMLVDRSAGTTRFTVPAVSLLELSFPTYAADAVPAELASIPVQKPGS